MKIMQHALLKQRWPTSKEIKSNTSYQSIFFTYELLGLDIDVMQIKSHDNLAD